MKGRVVYIVSGKVGATLIKKELYLGKSTEYALKWHLARKRQYGKYWARAVYYVDGIEHDYWTGELNPEGNGSHQTFWKSLPSKMSAPPKPKKVHRGEANHRAKLTAKDIREIRELHKQGETDTRIAERFGICRRHVANIRQRRNWAHV